MTENIKADLLHLSAKVTEVGHQMCDHLEDLHNKVENDLSSEEQDILADDEQFKLAQADMDKLHKRMVKLGIA